MAEYMLGADIGGAMKAVFGIEETTGDALLSSFLLLDFFLWCLERDRDGDEL